jgi:pimeloyl-ACP methyl ester carboxylesterase
MRQQQPDRPYRVATEHTVVADDHVLLHAEVSGFRGAPVTVVLCHGYGLSSSSWCFQRVALASRARVVAWDLRGHGGSAYGAPGSGNIDQMGRDLFEVIEQVVPEGPVVLVGHSMGGMAIMALAEQHPELFGDRVIAVALLATSAGPVNPSLGLPVGGAALHLAAHWVLERLSPDLLPLLNLVRSLPGYRPAARSLARRLAFASDVSRDVVDLLIDLLDATSPHVGRDAFGQFRLHDKRAALEVLQQVTTLVMVGEKDVITPPRDSEEIASTVPGADLVVVPDCGHALILERPSEVTEWLLAIVDPVQAEQAG